MRKEDAERGKRMRKEAGGCGKRKEDAETGGRKSAESKRKSSLRVPGLRDIACEFGLVGKRPSLCVRVAVVIM
eukprot:3029039-Rhodomonas_salina.1